LTNLRFKTAIKPDMKTLTFALALLLATTVAGRSQEDYTKAKKVNVKKAKANPAFAQITDDPKLPRVLLIGDSISMGYTVPVRELLQGKANLHRPLENCGPTSRGITNLTAWLGDGKWAVIHFNFGLHDLKIMPDGNHQVTPENYEKNLRRLVKQLKDTGAKLIWCSTTPVPEGKLNPARKNEDVQTYNAIAKKIMEENGVPIDDLYTFALPRLEKIQRPANVHFTDAGSKELAKPVAASIEAALKEKK